MENPYYLSDIGNDPSQSIAEALLDDQTILGHGRRQHGLNGKNADLDKGGQCVIKSITILDPVKSDTLIISIEVQHYANICTPTDDDEKREKSLQENAEFLVMDACAYSGEWTGSDYWCFSHNETVKVPLTLDEYEEDTNEENLKLLAERCADAVYNSSEGNDFETWSGELWQSVEDLHKLTNEALGI
jgi:hypothetical protein